MNEVILKGIIQDIKYSHLLNNVEYNQANIIVHDNGYDNIIPIKFKKYTNRYKDGDQVELIANLRSHSYRLSDKNKVDVYCFTYFDIPETDDVVNEVQIDGRICKIDQLRTTSSGKNNLHFILANNIISGSNQKLNNYIPCVIWGKLAIDNLDLQISDYIKAKGKLHSRLYKKVIDENTNEIEFRTAYELVVTEIER